MKRIYFVFCIFLTVYTSVYAQTELKKDSLVLDKNILPILPEMKFGTGHSSQSPIDFRLPNNRSKVKCSELDLIKLGTVTFKLDKLKDLTSPYTSIPTLNPLVSTSFNYNSGLMDYNNSQVRMLGKRSAFIMEGSSTNYIGLGVTNTMGVDYLYQPIKRLTLGLGANAVKYTNMSGTFNDVVLKANATYALANWLLLDVFGQYAVNASRNQKTSMMYSPFASQSNYGGAVTLKLTDNFGVRVGAVREFNVMTRKWETYSTLSPVFFK